MKKVNSILGRIEASLNGSLDGLELDNMDDVIEKSLVIEMVKDLKMLVDEAKQEVKKLNILAVIKPLPFTCGSCGSLFAKKPEHDYCPICKVYNIKGNDL